jgi:hypothetical protein
LLRLLLLPSLHDCDRERSYHETSKIYHAFPFIIYRGAYEIYGI